MNGETAIFGVLINAEFITSFFALVLTFAVHRVLIFFGLHRRIWHPALFETALFIILWGLIMHFSIQTTS